MKYPRPQYNQQRFYDNNMGGGNPMNPNMNPMRGGYNNPMGYQNRGGYNQQGGFNPMNRYQNQGN